MNRHCFLVRGRNQEVGLDRFSELATAAGSCLAELSPELLPPEQDDQYPWLVAVHRLALRQPKNSLLCVERSTWEDRPPRVFERRGDLPDFKKYLWERTFTVLPYNVFLSSAYAIDLIEAGFAGNGPKATHPEPNTVYDRRASVKMMIEALGESGLWGVLPREIARRTGIAQSTLYRYLEHPTVKPAWERYKRDSTGQSPANLDKLGDAGVFSRFDPDRE
jgi:hypothetical protein